MTDFWNGCKRAVYLVLFAILIPVSAYVFYGAVDTLNNAAVLQGILHGKMVPAFCWEPLFVLRVVSGTVQDRRTMDREALAEGSTTAGDRDVCGAGAVCADGQKLSSSGSSEDL